MYIHKEGYIHILIATVLFIALGWLNYHFLYFIPVLYWLIQLVLFLVWFWVLWFFRIPVRKFTEGQDLVVAPADGKVVVIEETQENEYFKDKRLQVSIFMSPANVHINRIPMSGKIEYSQYHKGKYLVAWNPKSSTENERHSVVIRSDSAIILVKQIAGAMAKRIVNYLKVGEYVSQGNEMGFIKFGSRVDVLLPVGTELNVALNQKVKGGITVLATIDTLVPVDEPNTGGNDSVAV